jgi:hypothetical protein
MEFLLFYNDNYLWLLVEYTTDDNILQEIVNRIAAIWRTAERSILIFHVHVNGHVISL